MTSCLAITEKWNPRFHGVGCDERMLNYFNIMENLDFVTFILEDLYNTYNLNEAVEIFSVNQQFIKRACESRRIKLMILKGHYEFRGRMFGIPNKSFIRFISKIKKRYKRKLDLKKSIKYLRFRECNGRFK